MRRDEMFEVFDPFGIIVRFRKKEVLHVFEMVRMLTPILGQCDRGHMTIAYFLVFQHKGRRGNLAFNHFFRVAKEVTVVRPS